MKQLLFIMLVWLVPFASKADPEINIALKGGPNAATLAEDFRFNRYGLSGGLASHLQWLISDRFSLAGQVELLYTPRGSEVVFDGELAGKSREHYTDVIVALRPGVRLGRASIYLLLGGGLNFLVSANKENVSGAKQNITGDLHRVDVALLGGAGIALHLPRQELGPFRVGTVFLEARHDVGLLDTDAVNGGFKNRTSSLMLGLSFVLPSGAAVVSPSSPPARSGPPSP